MARSYFLLAFLLGLLALLDFGRGGGFRGRSWWSRCRGRTTITILRFAFVALRRGHDDRRSGNRFLLFFSVGVLNQTSISSFAWMFSLMHLHLQRLGWISRVCASSSPFGPFCDDDANDVQRLQRRRLPEHRPPLVDDVHQTVADDRLRTRERDNHFRSRFVLSTRPTSMIRWETRTWFARVDENSIPDVFARIESLALETDLTWTYFSCFFLQPVLLFQFRLLHQLEETKESSVMARETTLRTLLNVNLMFPASSAPARLSVEIISANFSNVESTSIE